MRPKTDKEIEIMRAGGRMLANVLNKLSQELTPGMSTKDLALVAAREIKSLGGQPSFLNHENFPEVLCVSLNEELVHGIPSAKRIIKEGDVVGLDFGVIYKGLIVDGATSLVAGDRQPLPDVKRLLEGTKQALSVGVEAVRGDGTRVGDISFAIQQELDRYKLGVIRDLVGHGVGDKIHEQPNIPNYGARGTGAALRTGMTIAIEPMASLGDWRVDTAPDGWTVVMHDGSLAAHFEHTVLVTKNGAEILTTL